MDADALARRLRELRESGLFGTRVTQRGLATALGATGQLISSWERIDAPTTPPAERLQGYARFFATPRSLEDGHPRLLTDQELSAQDLARLEALENELLGMRAAALGQAGSSHLVNQLRSSAGTAPLRFPPGEDITIVSAQLPADRWPTQITPIDPDYVESYQYADLDSLIELFGHIRAVNPDNQVSIRVPEKLVDDDRSGHLVLLGGVDWNGLVSRMYRRVGVPLRQLSRATDADPGGFQLGEGPSSEILTPTLEEEDEFTDIGHFLQAPNPYNTKRSLTIFNASYALGVYGMVRALTDVRLRDRNAGYLATRFAESNVSSILCYVQIIAGGIRVPDWNSPESLLHEWPEA
ncbi:helix-turn-helix domain-containing protein [Actinoplanes sp. CA-051413]|uniref:helix-turn-helix domain-containing protein n=1 Tax=Actinoplanes sp. CA-051413 TaxID=3239899 RepID=UPI003D9596BC